MVVYLEFLFDHIYYEIIFKDRILVKDQHIYSYIVTFNEMLGISNRVIDFSYKRFPKPYLLFFIKINKKTSIARNKNINKRHIASDEKLHERMLRSYDELARTKKALVIDNDYDLTGSVRRVEEYVQAKDKLLKVKRISISGLDGSGKTTIARLLCDYAKQLKFSCRVVSFYHRSLPFKLLKWLKIWPSDARIKQRKKRRSGAWAFLTLLDSYIQYFFSIILFNRGLIVFDRFFHDYLVSFEHLGVKKTSFFLRHTMPKLDGNFLLLCSPQTCLKRKQEATLSYLIESSKNYDKAPRIIR